MERSKIFSLFTCLTISIVVTTVYFFRVEVPLYENIRNFHDNLISFDGSDNAPFKYRIIVPLFSEFIQSVLNFFFNTEISFKLSHIFLNLVSTFMYLFFTYLYFKEYFGNSTSLIGVLLIGILINIHLKDLYIANTLLDAAFFVLAILLIKKEKYFILLPLLLFAGLNRETSILIVIIFFIKKIFLKSIKRKNIYYFFYLSSLYIIIFFGLRFILGDANHTASYDGNHFLYNTFLGNIKFEYFLFSIFLYFMIFGLLWFYIFKGFKNLEIDLKENHLILLFYLPLIWTFGAWYETRLLIIMYPIILTSILKYYEIQIEKIN